MRKMSLEDKMDLATIKRYAWDEGYHAGVLQGMQIAGWCNGVLKQQPVGPKNPWYLLIFRHYNKLWKQGER